jgi:MFS family permease
MAIASLLLSPDPTIALCPDAAGSRGRVWLIVMTKHTLQGVGAMHNRVLTDIRIGSSLPQDKDWPAVAASATGLVFSVGTLSIYTFGVFVRPLTAEFGWSRTELFGALAVSQYALALSGPIWGMLVDRFGSRAIMLPSTTVISLSFASLALLTANLSQLYLVFALVPLLAGGASPLGYSAIIIRKFERKLGQALGLALMGVGLGATVLPPLTQTLTGALGWRGAFASLGLITFLVTCPAAWIATRGLAPPAVSSAGADLSAVMKVVRTRTFMLLCLQFVLIGTVSVGALAHLVPLMADRGLTPDVAARVAALTGLAAIVGRGGLGFILDHQFDGPF